MTFWDIALGIIIAVAAIFLFRLLVTIINIIVYVSKESKRRLEREERKR